MICRACQSEDLVSVINLGFSPPSNAFLKKEDMMQGEVYYPLRVKICTNCFLLQTEDFRRAEELFVEDYVYFSSASSSWLKHAEKYCEQITNKLDLNPESFVVEIASNDGYLLKNFKNKNIKCLGIEPTIAAAEVAINLGIEVAMDFFTEDFARGLVDKYNKADLIIGNNVYAHVPNINDFTKGLKFLLSDNGTITLEFPHVLNLIKFNQFDTIYHEHFSYLSLSVVKYLFEKNDMEIYHVEKLTTHGGSLRVFGCHKTRKQVSNSVSDLIEEEKEFGLFDLSQYQSFEEQAFKIKFSFLELLLEFKRKNLKVVGYGAAAKGNTLLNFCGVGKDLIQYVYDASKSKQGKFLPGSHIPVKNPKEIYADKPDVVIIFPWNLSNEILNEYKSLMENSTEFFTIIPTIKKL